MPARRTEITEVVTGLGTLGHDKLESALEAKPSELVNVPETVWSRVVASFQEGRHRIEFEGAWQNGRALLDARWGLRGRRPLRIEWKGPQKAPAYEFLPADLRIDHVFLVSCKHDSDVLANTSPAHLFDDLQWGRIEARRGDWFAEVAPDAYQRFYEAVRDELGARDSLPRLVTALSTHERQAIRSTLPDRRWPSTLQGPYEAFALAVSTASATRWRDAMKSKGRQELAFWRLVRMGAAPYYLLGSARGERLRLRVGTPWDWKQQFELRKFAVVARPAAQPRVEWEVRFRDRVRDTERSIGGYVEIRWSHGRFSGAPEAKVQLRSRHTDVPGYFALD